MWGSAVSSPNGIWGEAQPIFIMVQFELHKWPLVIGFFKDLCMKIPSFYGSNEWNGKRNFTNSTQNGGKTAEMRNNSAKSGMVGMSALFACLHPTFDIHQTRPTETSIAASTSSPCMPMETRISMCCGRSTTLPLIFNRYDLSSVCKFTLHLHPSQNSHQFTSGTIYK